MPANTFTFYLSLVRQTPRQSSQLLAPMLNQSWPAFPPNVSSPSCALRSPLNATNYWLFLKDVSHFVCHLSVHASLTTFTIQYDVSRVYFVPLPHILTFYQLKSSRLLIMFKKFQLFFIISSKPKLGSYRSNKLRSPELC